MSTEKPETRLQKPDNKNQTLPRSDSAKRSKAKPDKDFSVLGAILRICSMRGVFKRPVSGQIATYLIFFMLITLMLIMVTVDIGEVSLTATTLLNAANTAALFLGSNIATQSNIMWNNMEQNTKQCQTRGLAGIISAIVVAVIGIILTAMGVPVGPYLIMIAAGLAKVFGDAYVYETYRGAIMSFVQGAMIGAAVYAVGTAAIDLVGGAATLSEVGIAGVTEAIVLPGIGLAAMTYNELQVAKGMDVAMDTIMKALNVLPPKTKYRAQAFLSALSATVDDPTMEKDNSLMFRYDKDNADGDYNPNTGTETLFLGDSDGDGNTDELVPAFQNWWWFYYAQLRFDDWRLKDPTVVSNFINGPLRNFRNSVGQMYEPVDCYTGRVHFRWWEHNPYCDMVCHDEYDYSVDPPVIISSLCPSGELTRQEIEGADGTVVSFLRTVEGNGWYNFTFWDAGPNSTDLFNWYDCDTDAQSCPAPNAYDPLDALIDLSVEFIEYADTTLNTSIDELIKSWAYNGEDSWIGFLKNPGIDADDTDYYEQFGEYLEAYGNEGFVGLQGWVDQITAFRDSRPVCTTDGGGNINNFPCQTSIDADTDDEFTEVRNILNNFISAIRDFQTAIDNTFGGTGTILLDDELRYAWLDSRGNHWVEVEVGLFQFASTYKTKSCSSLGCGWKRRTCIYMTNYEDTNGTNTWVKVTRYDEPTGLWKFWPWKISTVTKKACIAYSVNYVNLTRCP